MCHQLTDEQLILLIERARRELERMDWEYKQLLEHLEILEQERRRRGSEKRD